MLKYLFLTLVLVHGLIHIMGFSKAFGYGHLQQLTKAISKPMGVLWLLACLLLLAAGIGFITKKEWWPLLGIVAAIVSQIVIIISWRDAKFGTIANIILLAVGIAAWASQRFEQVFIADVKRNLVTNNAISGSLVTETAIAHLPPPVQQYLRYSGALNQPQVYNMRIVFEGQMRSKGKDWFPFTTVQYNFFGKPTRLFFMKATMFGTTVPGYHRYENGRASMDVKLFGLFSVTKAQGDLMDKAETVTLFNDMCLLAPGSLIDKRIQWQPVDSLTAKAIFTNGAISISATLYFNGQGQLVNFVCNERYDVGNKKEYPFSTPVTAYAPINGRHLFYKGSAVWHYPDGEFEYGQFIRKEIAYNVTDYKN
jgi:hypothetical protein